MDFYKIKKQVTEPNPQSFLTTLLRTEQSEDSSIIFSQNAEEHFEQAVSYLASDETISLKDVVEWQKDLFLVVAQTIDGDYIAGTVNQTFVIPVSLYKSDIETYNLFLSEFFTAYTEGTIESTVLPKFSE
ncbi:hypothetical protein [Enterococcus sp. 5H]|uniref:hypothetical protein n=1 Tax=Enterococcus sp. 5H TaxID=1229490 RepID=UPI002301FF8C|nr:hypothetical protein [Enterococcus sp. 5H]MDA9470101.1 hypothetical protein [Enterococcus sp. 5H]